ncbi:MAG: hypothetical protein DRQ88_00030 [Epsilonproteobacteria bacterium]|nr:MAG: hypothetical protein DRQ88_00030 [Campylobacterota bacterium]
MALLITNGIFSLKCSREVTSLTHSTLFLITPFVRNKIYKFLPCFNSQNHSEILRKISNTFLNSRKNEEIDQKQSDSLDIENKYP